MMYTRYRLASQMAPGKRVLEVGCGSGQGFGLVGGAAARVMGGDYSLPLLRRARAHYGARFPLVGLTAERLPFRAAAFDVVLCFEASYYIRDAPAAFGEMTRVLRPGGDILFVNANPERPDFITSPHSTHYHTADEFRSTLSALGLEVTVEGAFPLDAGASGVRAIPAVLASAARRLLARLHLIPRTLRGRARLKRLISSRLTPVPPELSSDLAHEAPRTPVPPGPVSGYKVLYVSARKPRPSR